MRVVVIGFGSIGKRHVNNLLKMGILDIILYREHSQGNNLGLKEIQDIEAVKELKPDFVIVSNPTFLHFRILKFLIKNQLNILCEKPLIDKREDWLELKDYLNNYTGYARLVYNLRYHPCIIKVKEILSENKIGKINFGRFFVGQYLPDWRPNSNHLESYSSRKEMGGGVILDLVHEIDIAEYLINPPSIDIYAIVNKVSDVTINSEDISEIIYKTTKNEIVNIHLDYLYRGYARNFLICGKEKNLTCDLFENKVQISGEINSKIETFEFSNFIQNDMYYNLLQDYIQGMKNPQINIKLPTFYDNESVLETCFKINN